MRAARRATEIPMPPIVYLCLTVCNHLEKMPEDMGKSFLSLKVNALDLNIA
jgi:hypothetical protein